jgi:hypothetical protein
MRLQIGMKTPCPCSAALLRLLQPRSARVVGLGHRYAPNLGYTRPRPVRWGVDWVVATAPRPTAAAIGSATRLPAPPGVPPLPAPPGVPPPAAALDRPPLRTALFASAAFQSAYAAQRIPSPVPVLWVMAMWCSPTIPAGPPFASVQCGSSLFQFDYYLRHTQAGWHRPSALGLRSGWDLDWDLRHEIHIEPPPRGAQPPGAQPSAAITNGHTLP